MVQAQGMVSLLSEMEERGRVLAGSPCVHSCYGHVIKGARGYFGSCKEASHSQVATIVHQSYASVGAGSVRGEFSVEKRKITADACQEPSQSF